MNAPRVSGEDYIQVLVASADDATATEAARCQPDPAAGPAHDAFTRLLTRLEPDPAALWDEVRPLIDPAKGVLILDDTTLDKPYARRIALVCRHWSGKHKAVVRGINLLTAVWADGGQVQPLDYRLYDKAADGKTKNDHFADLVRDAHARGLSPSAVLFDGWYSGLDNLKAVRACGWVFLTRLKCNRLVRVERGDPTAVSAADIPAAGRVVWLPGFGEVKVFRVVAPDGDAAHWATNDLGLTAVGRVGLAEQSWAVEAYHRGLKQHTAAERCQARSGRAQRNHIGLAVRAFVRLEWFRWRTGVSWVEAKRRILRDAIRGYLRAPFCTLPDPSTA